MKLTIYYLKSCDTCRKAINALKQAGHELELIDVRQDGIDPDVLKNAISAHGWDAVLNRRSTTWRSLDDDNKGELDDRKAGSLITQHPTLMKRPLILSEQNSTIGWKSEQEKIWLG